MNDALEHDEHSVLARMREQIAATPMRPAPRRLPSSFRGARPRVLAGASAGIAALAATLVLVFAGSRARRRSPSRPTLTGRRQSRSTR
jgi:hypothetical protein